MKISSKALVVIIFVILFGGIGVAKGLNLWHTESTKIPAKYTTGEFAGQFNPEDIRGSFTFQDISNSFEISVEELAKAFGIKTSDPASFKVKDLGSIYSTLEAEGKAVETASVRMFVAYYKGMPFEITEETYLPRPGVEILETQGNLTAEQTKYLENHTVEPIDPAKIIEFSSNDFDSNNNSEKTKSTESKDSSESSDKSENSTDTTIKGKTTFKELLDWGISKIEIEQIIGGKIPSTGMTVRDYCTQKELEFSTIKTKLQEKVDI